MATVLSSSKTRCCICQVVECKSMYSISSHVRAPRPSPINAITPSSGNLENAIFKAAGAVGTVQNRTSIPRMISVRDWSGRSIIWVRRCDFVTEVLAGGEDFRRDRESCRNGHRLTGRVDLLLRTERKMLLARQLAIVLPSLPPSAAGDEQKALPIFDASHRLPPLEPL